MLRDNCSRENVLQRINAQWTDEQRIAKSDFIVENADTSTARLQIDYILKNLYNQQ
jgi:dephospho-CoA kinase